MNRNGVEGGGGRSPEDMEFSATVVIFCIICGGALGIAAIIIRWFT